MKNYIETRLVQAKPMTRGEYNEYRGWEPPAGEDQTVDGYLVVQGGIETWTPACVFNKNFLEVDPNEKLPSGVSIGKGMVKDFIKEKHVTTLGDKTTLVRVVLVNGFEIIETSACVDKANYCEDLGAKICMDKIEDKIWGYLGFLLQTAYCGVK